MCWVWFSLNFLPNQTNQKESVHISTSMFICWQKARVTHKTVTYWWCRKHDEHVFTSKTLDLKLYAWSLHMWSKSTVCVTMISKQGVCSIKKINKKYLPLQSKAFSSLSARCHLMIKWRSASCWVVIKLLIIISWLLLLSMLFPLK